MERGTKTHHRQALRPRQACVGHILRLDAGALGANAGSARRGARGEQQKKGEGHSFCFFRRYVVCSVSCPVARPNAINSAPVFPLVPTNQCKPKTPSAFLHLTHWSNE